MHGTEENQALTQELVRADTSQRKGHFSVDEIVLDDQISELQERYFQRAGQLIKAIKHSPSLRVSKLHWDELAFTRLTILDLEQIRENASRGSNEEVAALSAVITKLKRERREQAQVIEQLREQVLTLNSGAVPDISLQPYVEPEVPAIVEKPAPAPVVVRDVTNDLVVARIPGLKPINTPRRFLLNTAALATLAFAAFWGLTNLTSPKTHSQGEVAGVSTDTAGTATPDGQYPESFADVTFSNTIWDTTEDTDFGITLDYPKNSSNRVRIIGGDNMWFLRKNGFLMKISRIRTELSLDAWWNENQSTYVVDGDTPFQATLAGEPSWLIKPSSITETSGDRYFVGRPGAIFEIWVKNAEPTTDDGLRIERMLSSLTFTNAPQ